ncbi:MAG: hypothetical protein ACRDSN_07725, partial [Pseudonocardiaceae bacterium]
LRAESELLAHLRREAAKAKEQVELMHRAPMVAASSRIEHIVRLAEEEAAELRARVTKETDELRARAEQEATAHRKRAASEADALLRDMTARCRQLEAESERRRKAAERDAEREIARKECETDERIRLRDQRSLAALHLMLKIIGPQLAERVSAVEREEADLAEARTRAGKEMTVLETFRAKISAQLSATRQVLAEALEQVQQTTVEDSRSTRPVPMQRDGRPAAEDETVRLVNSRPDEHRYPAKPA